MSDFIRTIIVDDEPPAIRLLEKYIGKVSFLKLEATFTNPLEALQFIEKGAVDLVLLDIQMPEITGIQLSKIIQQKAHIIFTTAYPQFALESYDISAIDYLLKPIEFNRFYMAVSKVKPKEKEVISKADNEKYTFVKTDGKNKLVKVFFKDIYYFEGLKNYISIQLQDDCVITYSTLKSLYDKLPKSEFIQIHKSYIIAFKHIDKIDNQSVWINEKELPLGNTYKAAFFEKIAEKRML